MRLQSINMPLAELSIYMGLVIPCTIFHGDKPWNPSWWIAIIRYQNSISFFKFITSFPSSLIDFTRTIWGCNSGLDVFAKHIPAPPGPPATPKDVYQFKIYLAPRLILFLNFPLARCLLAKTWNNFSFFRIFRTGSCKGAHTSPTLASSTLWPNVIRSEIHTFHMQTHVLMHSSLFLTQSSSLPFAVVASLITYIVLQLLCMNRQCTHGFSNF